MISARLRLPG